MKFRLGITGGIGSGKSTVCRVFEVMHISVFYSDDEARNIMDNNLEIREGLNKIVGFDIYEAGELDRPRLAEIIFNNKETLSLVNKLVHPAVIDKFDSWCDRQVSDYVILESAILFESNIEWTTDKILAVIAPMEERILRVMERNSMTREQVIERIRNQIPENEMVRKSDFIINNADNEIVLPQVLSVHNEIMSIINSFNHNG